GKWMSLLKHILK
uniref:Halictine-2 n=1 Tax=Halictus sexcinctus TaxID=115105 RepID=HAL2_HALST|nr:RecName: Full=Halictine-2; Short=HAL-2; AltName: Full=Halictin 2; AltName: Full=Halictine II [Halictus sexcinctus]